MAACVRILALLELSAGLAASLPRFGTPFRPKLTRWGSSWLDAFSTRTKTNANGEKVASLIAASDSATAASGLSDAERIRVLERENAKLREEREILRKAAKYFAEETNW